ncbi:DUF2460 domain-containing protein [Acuticoccus mangrovi]|uniref:DUF2460 domain-containing protein n=1 Tax=Acuticoccus mangrovi TaxID=2796142 RepID=A0A934IK04_9HYPH|nr:DUF2460 domain-containing protein [Acuticoccus mangrovi]MBJ3776401.1 DUF2460 domain-containing protein [Acuticoccus mangrovi]
MAFHDVLLPPHILAGYRRTVQRRTEVTELAGGSEERNARWAASRRRFQIGYGVRDHDALADLIAFYEDRLGPLHTFRFRDWADRKSCAPTATPAATDVAIGTGDGSTTTFQLVKRYGSVSPFVRTITKPVSGTVLVALAGVAQASGWSVDLTTGVITFTMAPANGVAVRAGYEFDCEVRFEADDIGADVLHDTLGSVPDITLLEVRP